LIAAQRAIVRAGGTRRVAAATSIVLASLKHARMGTVLKLFETVDEALKG
jgi:hypothetical protein